MILEFADKSQIEINTIKGSPRLIFGSMRDTLSIEIPLEPIGFEELKDIFMDQNKTKSMSIHELQSAIDDNGDTQPITNVIKVGDGYQIFVSISDEVREIKDSPGQLGPVKTEELFVVTMSQITYAESQLMEKDWYLDEIIRMV